MNIEANPKRSMNELLRSLEQKGVPLKVHEGNKVEILNKPHTSFRWEAIGCIVEHMAVKGWRFDFASSADNTEFIVIFSRKRIDVPARGGSLLGAVVAAADNALS